VEKTNKSQCEKASGFKRKKLGTAAALRQIGIAKQEIHGFLERMEKSASVLSFSLFCAPA